MTEKKLPIAQRNAKFMEYYQKVQKTDDWNNVKVHKRIKYLQEGFNKETNIIMPIGTIYKLVKSQPAAENAKTEE